LNVSKRLPRYPSVPVARIGRLAVDQRHQRQGLGQALLVDAIQRSLASPIAVFAAIVDAKDEQGIAFYEHCGFIRVTAISRTLFLPIDDALRRNVRPPSP
jgi:ribosomal protein S18 acetylase RimI-like enzyme